MPRRCSLCQEEESHECDIIVGVTDDDDIHISDDKFDDDKIMVIMAKAMK